MLDAAKSLQTGMYWTCLLSRLVLEEAGVTSSLTLGRALRTTFRMGGSTGQV